MNPWWIAIGAAGLALTIILTYTSLVRTLTRLEMKVDILWEWFNTSPMAKDVPGFRRRDDWPSPPRRRSRAADAPATDPRD